MFAAVRRRFSDERGFTLVELLFVMLVFSMVTGLLVYATTAMFRTTRYGSQDSDALADLRRASDRIVRELRQATTVYATSTSTQLNMWVDYDVDQVVDTAEVISWRVTNVGGATKGQVARVTSAATPIVARDLTWDATYQYFTYNATRTLVTITLPADTNSGLAPVRTVRTQVRIRNAAS